MPENYKIKLRPNYTAPEIWYDTTVKNPKVTTLSYKSDMWSVGVILHLLLSDGLYPYRGKNSYYNERLSDIGVLDYTLPEFRDRSESSIDMSRKLL